jgi:hypothetical protein
MRVRNTRRESGSKTSSARASRASERRARERGGKAAALDVHIEERTPTLWPRSDHLICESACPAARAISATADGARGLAKPVVAVAALHLRRNCVLDWPRFLSFDK